MKKIILSITLLLINYSFAQHNIFIKAGPTYSWFVNAENSTPRIGYAIGIDKGFHLFKGLFWELGIGYTTRGATLIDRTIRPYRPVGSDIDSYYWDINGNIGYVDIPVSLKYNFKLNKKLALNLIAGTTRSIPTKDYSNLKQKRFYKIYDPQIHDRNYDYFFEQESAFGNNKARFIFGFGLRLQYSIHSLNLIYVIDDTKEYSFKNLYTIKYKINSILAYYSYEF